MAVLGQTATVIQPSPALVVADALMTGCGFIQMRRTLTALLRMMITVTVALVRGADVDVANVLPPPRGPDLHRVEGTGGTLKDPAVVDAPCSVVVTLVVAVDMSHLVL